MYKRVPPRSTVGLPWASNFNNIVAMDLITHKQGGWILYITMYLFDIQFLVLEDQMFGLCQEKHIWSYAKKYSKTT